jgi:hypothetical protein
VLHLVVNKEFTVNKQNADAASDMNLQINNEIEILLAYSNLSFNKSTIIVPIDTSTEYLSQSLNPIYGNSIGLFSIYQDAKPLGFSPIPKIGENYSNINSVADFFEG